MTPDTRTALETLLKECRTVLGFAQSWQPLTPGDLSDLRRAVDAASALLSTSPGEPCIGHDPLCPCQDGDSCHYVDTEDTKAWPIPETPS